MFSGDLLFAGSIGRTDLPGGDYPTILRSLAARCLPLPDDTVVLPGHGPQTTIGRERATNPYPARRPRRTRGPDTGDSTDDYERGSRRPRAPSTGCRRARERSSPCARLSPPRPAAPVTATSRRPSSRTPRCSRAASASPPTSSPRRCTPSTTRAAARSPCGPRAPLGVVRAVLQHGLHNGQLPVKLWYSGASFRYERPQKGRYRHFCQVGAEALGSEDPALDAELIVAGRRRLPPRSACARSGCCSTRSATASAAPSTAPRCRSSCAASTSTRPPGPRIEINPLRVLDDKRPEVQAQLADAPLVVDHLCDACKAYHDEVRALLTALGVAVRGRPAAGARPRLLHPHHVRVRRTTGSARSPRIGGGGRYDGLSETLGGPPLPGVGWALGVDRTVLAHGGRGRRAPRPRRPRPGVRCAAGRGRPAAGCSCSSPSCAGRASPPTWPSAARASRAR